jgi:hypothetical protein
LNEAAPCRRCGVFQIPAGFHSKNFETANAKFVNVRDLSAVKLQIVDFEEIFSVMEIYITQDSV